MLQWTAPGDLPSNGTVAQYELRYATFAVSGSTAAWWAGATTYGLMGAYTPSAPGVSEFFMVDNLPAGSTYYFALRSRDVAGNWSDLDSGAVSGPQASATPLGVRPAPVAGLLSITHPDTSVDLNWNPVLLNEDGTAAVDIVDYVVRRSNSLTGPFSTVVPDGAGANSFFVGLSSAPATDDFILVSAVDAAGNESDPSLSNILHVTPQGIIGQLALAQDGTLSRSYVPASQMGELRTADGDLLIRVSRNADPSVNRDPRALSTYDVSFISPAQVVDKNFTLSRPAMNVVLQSTTPVTAGSAGVLWWNGNAWIKVGDVTVDEISDTVSFYTANPGRYQLRSFQTASQLTLDKASVFPRIFSPNGDGVNDRVLFVVDNPNGASVDGKIYDVDGAEVSDLRPAGAGAPTADTLAWNGRDRNGDLVAAGVYIYRVKGEGKTISGTVVVAK